MKSYVCPTEGIESNKNDTILYHHLEHGKTVSVEVINSAKTRIMAIISFEGIWEISVRSTKIIAPYPSAILFIPLAVPSI